MMAQAATDQEFLDFVVRALVDNPDKVKITRTVDEMGVLLTLEVDPKDLGQIIGRQGQTAKSVRTLLRVIGAKNQARVNLKIYEPEGSRKPRRDEQQPEAAAPDTSTIDTSAIDNLDI